MANAEFSLVGFWLGTSLLMLVAAFVLAWHFRRVEKNPEKRSAMNAFAMGFVTFPLVGFVSVKFYFPFFYWLAAALGL